MVTRNRHADLAATLESISQQQTKGWLRLLLVDGSDPDLVSETRRIAADFSAGQVDYLQFPGAPSAARQRNYALDRLPADSEVVFFLDDDVTLYPGFLQTLADALEQDMTLGGIGGIKMDAEGRPLVTPNNLMWLRRIFLNDHPEPGRLLVSGCTSPASSRPISERTDVEWLTSCGMAVCRTVADEFRFEEGLTGYSLHSDLDFTYRISRKWRLAVDPKARLVHHKSPTNRMSREEYARRLLIHQYWIVEKNIRHPLKKPAFWWASVGRYLGLLASRHPHARDVRRGLLRGLPVIVKRDYPLLQRKYASDG
jgi:GT2 family glycosyltransferase